MSNIYASRIFLVFLLVLVSARGLAQKKIISENQDLLWTRYHLTLKFSDRWKWATEADNRLFVSSFNRAQFIAHTHVHRSFGEQAEVSLGFTYSNTNPAEPFNEHPVSTPEYRPFQELYLKHILQEERIHVQHRFRSEERFFIPAESKVIFNWRFRYQIALSYILSKKWGVKLNNETFINAGKNVVFNTFDANRLYGALAFKVMKPLTIELGYLRSIQQLKSGDAYLKRDNIRFTLFHQIDFK